MVLNLIIGMVPQFMARSPMMFGIVPDFWNGPQFVQWSPIWFEMVPNVVWNGP